MRTVLVVMLLSLAGGAGCGGDDPTATSNAPAASTPAATAGTTIAGTPTAEPSMESGGKWYTARYFTCAQKLWDGRVALWNQLPSAERDRWSGSEAWMKAKGWPVSFDATLRAEATKRACPPGR